MIISLMFKIVEVWIYLITTEDYCYNSYKIYANCPEYHFIRFCVLQYISVNVIVYNEIFKK